MKMSRTSVVVVLGASALCLVVLPLAWAQQPAQPPNPVNPSPRPLEPNPKPIDPNNPNRPGNPGNPGNPNNPNTPRDPNNPSTPRNPNDPNSNDPNDRRNPNRDGKNSEKNARPFAFQNPQDESRFVEGSQKLVRMERKFEQANQELNKRLGEVRQMPADRQSAALMDLLQQMMKHQTEMHQYLVASRTMWTGDVDVSGMSEDGNDGNRPGDQRRPGNPNQPTAPGAIPPR